MMTSFHPPAICLSRVGSLAWAVCAGIALLTAVPAKARWAGENENRIAKCIRQAAGGKVWLEKTLWGLRDQEGGWIGAEVRNTNGSHDLGPLQINSWWVPKIAALVGRPQADVRIWLVSDPCFNAGAARWLFLTALRTTGDFWQAVGVYHSPTAWRQRRYAQSVARHMQRRFGDDVFAAPLEMDATLPAPGSSGEPSAPSFRMHGFGVVQGLSSDVGYEAAGS